MRPIARFATHCVLPKMQYVNGRVAKLLRVLMNCPEVSAETSEAECEAHNRLTVVPPKEAKRKDRSIALRRAFVFEAKSMA